MSSYNNLLQRVDVYYSPAETGGGARRPFPKDEVAFPAFPSSETERHLQKAYDTLARLRQAVGSDPR